MTLKKAIQLKNIKEIRKIVSSTPLPEIAKKIVDLDSRERVLFFTLSKSSDQSEIFSMINTDVQEDIIRGFTDKQIEEIVGDLYADEIADLIEDVPSSIAFRILKNTPLERRTDVNKILRYKDEDVGSVMTVDILTFKQTLVVGDAIKIIKEKKDGLYIGHYIFVVDSKYLLVGSIKVEDLLFSSNSTKLKDLAKPMAFVTTTTNKEVAAKIFADNDMSMLPVVNSSKHVIGAITADDMIDVVQEAATEDFQKMAGIDYDEEGVPYSRSKTFKLFRSRIIWLMLLMLSATISQIVLDSFQGIAHSVLDARHATIVNSGIWTTAIVAILPVISGAAGNAGSQSSTMVIRSLAIGDITTKDYLKVVWKEAKVSLAIGITMAIANFIRLMIYYAADGKLQSDQSTDFVFLALAASIALLAVIVLAKVVGGTLPLLAKKMKLDPAVMAAPLLTTLIDALSTTIFFGISIGIMAAIL